MEIDLDELSDFIFKILRLVLHIESPPINPFDILEPLITNELIPHGQRHTSSRVGLKYAKTVLFVLEDHTNMITLWISEESLDFRESMVVSKEDNVTRLAVFGELLLSGIPVLS